MSAGQWIALLAAFLLTSWALANPARILPAEPAPQAQHACRT